MPGPSTASQEATTGGLQVRRSKKRKYKSNSVGNLFRDEHQRNFLSPNVAEGVQNWRIWSFVPRIPLYAGGWEEDKLYRLVRTKLSCPLPPNHEANFLRSHYTTTTMSEVTLLDTLAAEKLK